MTPEDILKQAAMRAEERDAATGMVDVNKQFSRIFSIPVVDSYLEALNTATANQLNRRK